MNGAPRCTRMQSPGAVNFVKIRLGQVDLMEHMRHEVHGGEDPGYNNL